jgi:hypothetical protein
MYIIRENKIVQSVFRAYYVSKHEILYADTLLGITYKTCAKLLFKSAITKYLEGESQVRATNFHLRAITAHV